ncbi:hypothetical protein ELI02_10975 [Rhizobium leguminosarum]|uniref:hypothetical protein n=1 Tax=Rhizobium leguminosarum TaxID=384 RepID=UPI0010326343|nr:hypothetical protein [Rhizobium leguminosarum]TAV49124.1 hypothetical protein ELI32_13495 [Rhizobium leguminosarum]TAV58486.1 hypothetical protein ELI31_12015 [Rhizobium leguminosarum]TAV69535.1 hypothetical protein ELI30_12800 [Rhizobium leguminosarum]TAX55991.1 hypothetical protein ELI01_12530 [Rhizobium leguminosarum]TAX60497.1 hypothetical protein ELI02_10975 [Rhizobium leguminosarum]
MPKAKKQETARPKDGSMAIWCCARTDNPPASLEVHFNLWRIAGDKEFAGRNGIAVRDFLEIGVMLSNPLSIEKVNIYLPASIKSGEIEDCSTRLALPSVAQGIFNEPLACTRTQRPVRIELKTPDGVFCRVHEFMLDGSVIDASQLEVAAENSDGTFLSITRAAIESVCSGWRDGERAYFRLRVYLNPNDNGHFIRIIRPSDRNFQSGSQEIEYIDFRFNELRTLPPQIELRIKSDEAVKKVPITLIAFLTAFPINSELAASSIQWHKNRLLEFSPWNDYVPTGVPDGMVVYHWRRVAEPGKELLDFSSFVKLQTRRTGRKTVIKYLTIAFAFGLLGNLIATVLSSSMVGLYHAIFASK